MTKKQRNIYLKKRRIQLRKKGLCIVCASDANGRSRCSKCASVSRKISANNSARKTKNKICVRCDSPRFKLRLCKKHFEDRAKLKDIRLANGLCTNCGDKALLKHRFCAACLKPRREYKQRIKVEALQHYGGKCKCCGEQRIEFLVIDHINGGGNKHRQEINESIYRWLKRNNYPLGFRVLCANCNSSYGSFGYCPHKAKSHFSSLR